MLVMIVDSLSPRQNDEIFRNDGFDRFTEDFGGYSDVGLLSLSLLIREIFVEVLMNRRSFH